MKEENPWNIHSIYDLLYFNCPSCAYKNPVKQEFVDHAYQLHPESEQYLRNISDGSLSDVEIPPYYDHHEMKANIVKVEEESACNICNITFCNQTLLEEHENLLHLSERENQSNNQTEYYDDVLGGDDNQEYNDDIKTEQFENTKGDDTSSKPKISKYDKYFEINHKTKKGKCKICTHYTCVYENIKNHLKSQHQIIIGKGRGKVGLKNMAIENGEEYDNENPPVKYECETCDKSFQSEQEMNDHFLDVHKKLMCPECHKCYRSKIALDEHINLKHNENSDLEFKVQCEKCDKIIAKSWYQQHMVKIHGALKKEKCEYCELEFDDKKTLRVHFRTEHSDITGNYKCQVCGKSYMEKVRLMQHHISVHNKKFICQDCGHSLGSKYDLELHVKRQHEGIEIEKINCEICGKTLTKSSIKSHLAMVHGEGGQNCKCKVENCGKEFNHPQQLKAHMERCHNDGNKVQCKICGKLLKAVATLNLHVKTVHEGIKAFMCTLCGKKFTNSQSLKLHETVHSGSRNWECKDCAKTFKMPAHYRKHMKQVHILKGRKDHICSYCGKGFLEKQQMIRHSETVHEGIKKYTCDICPAAYGQGHELKKHKLKIHQVG